MQRVALPRDKCIWIVVKKAKMIKQPFVNSAYAPVRRGVICRQTLEIGKIQKSKSSKLDELEEIVYEEDNGADEEIEPDTTLKGADGQK